MWTKLIIQGQQTSSNIWFPHELSHLLGLSPSLVAFGPIGNRRHRSDCEFVYIPPPEFSSIQPGMQAGFEMTFFADQDFLPNFYSC